MKSHRRIRFAEPSCRFLAFLWLFLLSPLQVDSATLVSPAGQWVDPFGGIYFAPSAPDLPSARAFFDSLVGDVPLSSGTFPDVINDWNPSGALMSNTFIIGPAASTLEIDDSAAQTDLNNALGTKEVTFKMIRDLDNVTVLETTMTPVFNVVDTGSGVSFNLEFSDTFDLSAAGFTGFASAESFRYELTIIPEPASILMMLVALGTSAFVLRRRFFPRDTRGRS